MSMFDRQLVLRGTSSICKAKPGHTLLVAEDLQLRVLCDLLTPDCEEWAPCDHDLCTVSTAPDLFGAEFDYADLADAVRAKATTSEVFRCHDVLHRDTLLSQPEVPAGTCRVVREYLNYPHLQRVTELAFGALQQSIRPGRYAMTLTPMATRRMSLKAA